MEEESKGISSDHFPRIVKIDEEEAALRQWRREDIRWID